MSELKKIESNNEIVTQEKLIEYLKFNGTNLTDKELGMFLEISKQFQLNPFKREIYAIKYGSNFNLIVGYEVYIKRAERSGLLDGWQVTTENSGSDLKAIIKIQRKDRKYEFIHEVYMSEYAQQTKIWKEKPITMLKKVAISQGFRMCFSDELGGIPYTAEEVQTQDISYEAYDSLKDLKDEFVKLMEYPALESEKDRILVKIDKMNQLQLEKGIEWAKNLIIESESKTEEA